MQFSKQELDMLYDAGFSESDLSTLTHNKIQDPRHRTFANIETVQDLVEESGNGNHYINAHTVSIRRVRDLTVEKFDLAQGSFLRIRRGNTILQFTNLTEARKRQG